MAQTPEAVALLSYLTAQRKHVLGILDGLDDEQLRRPVLPSGWSCLGLVQHLRVDVERWWFSAVMAGDEAAVGEFTAADGPDAWVVGPDTSAPAVLSAYLDETERSDAVIGRLPLSATPAWWPASFGPSPVDDLRDTLLHVLAETACHAGHLDAVRELIDGRRWLVLN
jgi:hypothetical protein